MNRICFRHWIAALSLLSAVGCAGESYRPGLRPQTPASRDHEENHFTSDDGLRLFEQVWKTLGLDRGAVVIVHGLKDHSDRYTEFAKLLNAKGFTVYATDLRGHGDSQGDRAWVADFGDYLSDLALELKRVRAREKGKPIFLFGHSMGGAIATLYAIERDPDLAGLVLSAPALKLTDDVSGFRVFYTKIFGSVAPMLGLLQLDDAKLSRDPTVVAAVKQDPLIYDGAAPARTASELWGAIAEIQQDMPKLTVPLLVLHGSSDGLTNPEGSKELEERAASKDKELQLYTGFYHDLLHEPERGQVENDIVHWLDVRAPALTATANQ